MTKTFIWLGIFIGSTIGSYVPILWHASLFSLASIIGSTIGGTIGLWLGYKLGHDYFE